jgi:hypothetical protein
VIVMVIYGVCLVEYDITSSVDQDRIWISENGSETFGSVTRTLKCSLYICLYIDRAG